MDALDVLILRIMGIRPFVKGSPHRSLKAAAIARIVDKAPQVIKDRIHRMEASGVIRGYRIMPNLRHFGLKVGTVHLDVADASNRARLQAMAESEGILQGLSFYGARMCFDLSYGTAADSKRRLAMLERIAGDGAAAKWSYHWDFPTVERDLDLLDWRILHAWQKDARQSMRALAAEVGVTPKTVRKRVERMRSEGSVDAYVEVDFQQVTGVIPFMLYVWIDGDVGATISALMARFSEHHIGFFRSRDEEKEAFIIQLSARRAGEIEHAVAAARATPGVAGTETRMPTMGFVNTEWLADMLAARAGIDAGEAILAPAKPDAIS